MKWRKTDEASYYAAYPLRMYEGREEGISNVGVYREQRVSGLYRMSDM